MGNIGTQHPVRFEPLPETAPITEPAVQPTQEPVPA